MIRTAILLLSIAMVFTACAPVLAEETPLSQGSSGARVRQLQNRLIELGLLKGRADALYGKQTAQAVTRAQQHLKEQGHAIQVDGVAGPDILRLLFDDRAVSGLLDLKTGDKGERVSQLQSRLYDMRLLDSLPDGAYGDQTREAVLKFQQVLVDKQVPDAALTGIADHATRQALWADLKPLGLRLPHTFDDTQPASLLADDLYARAALVVDIATGRVYMDKQSNQRLYPASTTKIMTLLLALEMLKPDAVITIPEEARDVPEDSSITPVTPGEEMTVRDLLYGLMLRSGNDAANAVAVLCDGSVEAFVQRMNQKARDLGMQNTHFVNPHGYHDPQHFTTARDLARLTMFALTMPAFREVITHTEWTMQPTKLRQALPIKVNTDLFDPQSAFHYPGAFGVKSGYTRAAGFCYVGCAEKAGRTLLAVVLNDRTRDQAWTDIGRLFNLGFAVK